MDKEIFLNLLKERILILDGGMGTMVQGFKLTEKDYRGKQFADWTSDLKGNNDLLCITRPDVIKSIHRQYLDAGADIFATNTFNANAISMEDYGMQGQVRNINLAAGKLAREVADGFMKEHPDRTIFVAGSVGPTNKTASMSPDVSDPAYRAVTYLDLYSAYKEQVDALVDGGVDIVLFETTCESRTGSRRGCVEGKRQGFTNYAFSDVICPGRTYVFGADIACVFGFRATYQYC